MGKKHNPHINWSEGEAVTKEEIDERINQRLISSTSFLEALMQESPFMREHIAVIPVSLDVTQHEKVFNNQHFHKEGEKNAHDRYTH